LKENQLKQPLIEKSQEQEGLTKDTTAQNKGPVEVKTSVELLPKDEEFTEIIYDSDKIHKLKEYVPPDD
jgi:hypothetical protein